MRPPLVFILAAALAGPLPTRAQGTAPCSRSALISVSFPDGRLGRGLRAEQFMGRVKGKPIEINVDADSGPRRILILLDLGKSIGEEPWKAEMTAAMHLVSSGRPEDQFGLKTFNGPPEVVPFGQPKSALLARLQSMSATRPRGAYSPNTIPDEIAVGVDFFGEPLAGDAIVFLFGGEPEEPIAVRKAVRDKVSRTPIRIFGISFGQIYSGTLMGPTVISGSEINDLAVSSGGYILLANGDNPWKSYRFSAEVERALRFATVQLYGQIVETYRVEVQTSNTEKSIEWKLDLAPDIQKNFPALKVKHPKVLLPCNKNPQ